MITDSVYLFVIGLFRFSITSCFSHGRLPVSRNFYIFPDYPVCWCAVVYSSLSWSFAFLYNVQNFITDFICLSLLSSFLSLPKGLSMLFIFLKHQLLVLLIFSMVPLYHSDFRYFICSTNLGLTLFFFFQFVEL